MKPTTPHSSHSAPSVEEIVQDRISTGGRYGACFRDVTCRFDRGTITLYGRVPSFYLKQLIHTLLNDIHGVERIDDQIDVVSSSGRSSVKPK